MPLDLLLLLPLLLAALLPLVLLLLAAFFAPFFVLGFTCEATAEKDNMAPAGTQSYSDAELWECYTPY
jgi:hypothetical protein